MNPIEGYRTESGGGLISLRPDPHFHKGQKCIIYDLLCQEGYCTDCQIALRAVELVMNKPGVN